MSTMHKRLIAVALTLALVALPAGAQRGGSRSAPTGHGGGVSSAHSSAFHGSFTGPSRSTFTPSHQFSSSQFSGSRFAPARQAPGRITAPSNFNRRNDHDADDRFRGIDRNRDQRFRRAYNPISGVGLPYSVGFIGPDYFSSPDSGYYDSPAYTAQQPQPADDYGPPPPEQYPGPPYPADASPDSSYRPAYQRPQPESPLPSQEAVTLVFKDGRPNEQIYNYMLTRSTLYIQEQHLREISVDQLDLEAMAKVNGEAGVVFKLPGR
jgi:hypothetical protein